MPAVAVPTFSFQSRHAAGVPIVRADDSKASGKSGDSSPKSECLHVLKVYCHRIPNRIKPIVDAEHQELYNTDLQTWKKDKLFHWGHLELHRKLGRQEEAVAFAHHVTNFISAGKEKLVNNQRLVFVASLDKTTGMPWASLACSNAGGAGLLDGLESGTSLTMSLPDAKTGEGYVCENLLANMRQSGGTPACFLVMDYLTKNRARIRGAMTTNSESTVATLKGVESVPHCTRYIPKLEAFAPVTIDASKIKSHMSTTISQDQRDKISKAPSFYIATCTPELDRMEMSHRGGQPGFVRVLDEQTIVWPEYRGNGQLSTQGNLKAYSGASLLLPFCDGSIFQVVGTAICKYAEGACVDQQDIECHFFVQRIVETTGLALQWKLLSNSGMSPPVIEGCEGINVELDRELAKPSDASDLLAAGAAKAEVVRLRALLRSLKESAVEESNGQSSYNKPTKKLVKIRKGTLCAPGIKSYIVDSEGAFEMKHKPGQYINLLLDGGKNRYWTISGSPELLSTNSKVEITVKLEPEGRGGSKQLYEIDSDAGLQAEVLGIDGEMCVDLFEVKPRKKLLFLSSGIGITPFLCIARGLAAAHAAGVAKCDLDIVMMHSTRGLDAMPYYELLRSIELDSAGWRMGSFRLLVLDTAHKDAQSTQTIANPNLRTADVNGRCSAEVMTREVPDIRERHACICGAAGFTKAMLTSLEMVGLPQGQIQTEAFDF
eukprot:TRINITY_DN8087_c0_g1_i1.p1 TRINITY_DN8087_c0_g1~~TRINITY_DN8087_c0_g1_i1.p1  ORF type:complete len:814 (-),score=136.37 TRINITY_DN8087_c0_g1_i1:190-2337(-)